MFLPKDGGVVCSTSYNPETTLFRREEFFLTSDLKCSATPILGQIVSHWPVPSPNSYLPVSLFPCSANSYRLKWRRHLPQKQQTKQHHVPKNGLHPGLILDAVEV
jgi:hypothetical protein